MAREWALDLDMNGIRLMGRDVGQWEEFATISLEDTGFREALSACLAEHKVGPDVTVFLPPSQVLYRSVPITSDADASREIEAVLDEETPYSVQELEFDWELDGPHSARVAAVALETLDEARTFVEAFDLEISGFSALATPQDFPRRPDFGGADEVSLTDLADDDIALAAPLTAEIEDVTDPVEELEVHAEEGPDDAVTFASSRNSEERVTSEPLRLDASAPVIDVNDATPVVALDGTPEDRGFPDLKEPPLTAPRVVTDMAVTGLAGDTGEETARVISRSLDGSVLSRPIRQPLETPNRTTLALAAAMTLVVGGIVWSILPDTTPSTEDVVAASAPAPVPDVEVEPEIVEAPAPAIPELAQPTGVGTKMAQPLAPTAEAAPEVAAASFGPQFAPQALDLPLNNASADTVAIIGSLSVPHPDAGDYASVLAPFAIDAQSAAPSAFLDTRPPVILASLAPVSAEPGQQPDLAASDALSPPLAERPEALLGVSEIEPAALPDLPSATEAGSIEVAALEPANSVEEVVVLPPEVPADSQPLVEGAPAPAVPTAPDAEPAVVAEEPPSDAPSLPTPTALAQSVPDTRPSARPEGIAPTETEEPEIAEVGEETENGLPRPTALAASLPETRPPARTRILAPEVAEADDAVDPAEAPDTVLAAVEENPLARIRPPARPGSAQETAREAAGVSEASSLAVATSLQPRNRPSDLAARAEALRQQALQNARAPDTSAAITAALAPEESEPELPAAEPRNAPRLAIPTDVSVARQATIEDAIRLNRINLIGVYGLPSDRRALIRLPSGRYVKVKVGDRVDGGSVASITDTQVRYTKGGRTVTLQMPSG